VIPSGGKSSDGPPKSASPRGCVLDRPKSCGGSRDGWPTPFCGDHISADQRSGRFSHRSGHSAGAFAREYGLGVVVEGHDTNGLAVCNQVRSFDLDQRIKEGSAKFIESLDKTTTNDIVSKVLSIIDLQD
jgi:mRNA interferase ChpB